MTQIVSRSPTIFSQRRHKLSVAAEAVREQAISGGHDVVGWRLSRLMRDAETGHEIKIAERGYEVWLQADRPFRQTNPLPLECHIGT